MNVVVCVVVGVYHHARLARIGVDHLASVLLIQCLHGLSHLLSRVCFIDAEGMVLLILVRRELLTLPLQVIVDHLVVRLCAVGFQHVNRRVPAIMAIGSKCLRWLRVLIMNGKRLLHHARVLVEVLCFQLLISFSKSMIPYVSYSNRLEVLAPSGVPSVLQVGSFSAVNVVAFVFVVVDFIGGEQARLVVILCHQVLVGGHILLGVGYRVVS